MHTRRASPPGAVIFLLIVFASNLAAGQTRPADANAAIGGGKWVCAETAYPLKPFNGHDEPFTFSPDLSRFALKACNAKWQSNQVFVDGRPGPVHDSVGSVVFSPDSARVAYGAGKGDRSFLVLDGNEGPAFDGSIAQTVFSPDSRRLAYSGGNSPTTVMLDGKKLGAHEYVLMDSLAFSPDSAHLAYWAQDKEKFAVYLDGKLAGTADEPKTFSLRFLPNSKGLCYAFRRGGKAFVTFAGTTAGPFDDVDAISLAISADSARFACPVQRGESWRLLCDDKQHGPYAWVSMPAFSADSKRLAYLAREDASSVSVFMDGRRVGKYAGASGVVFSPDLRHHTFVIEAGGKAALYLDGNAVCGASAIDTLTFSPDSRRLAAVVEGEKGRSVWEAGRTGPACAVVDRLIFSPDSVHLAYVASDGPRRVDRLIIDGEVVRDLPGLLVEMAFTAPGRLRAYVLQPPSGLTDDASPQERFTAMSKGRILALDCRAR